MTAPVPTPNTVQVSAEQSGGRPAPAQDRLAVRLQLQYADSDAFVRDYAGNLSAAGMFIPADELPVVGAALRFAVVLADERCLLRGEGEVVWTAGAGPGQARAAQPAGPAPADAAPPLRGFGLRFLRLDAASREVVKQVLAYKATQPARFFTEPPDPYAPGGPHLPYGEERFGSTAPPAVPALPPTAAPATAAPSDLAAPTLAAPRPAGPLTAVDEEAELSALLQPAALAEPPAAGDAARLLDALLSRRPA